MADPADHLSRIRADLAGDLAKVEIELVEARTAAAAAEAAHQAALAESNALLDLAARGGQGINAEGKTITPMLAAPLHSRLSAARDEMVKPTERMRAQARTTIASLEHRRGTLMDSLRQIDSALSGERPAVSRLQPTPKRVAPIVEFNNVELRGASSR
jgi:hypothetical protein